MGTISEGMNVIVHSRADAEKTWNGMVSKIDMENAQAAGNSYGMVSSDGSATQSSNYPFYVELAVNDGLMLGQHVYIEPDNGQSAEPKKGLWLPEYFINDIDTDPYVWADNGKNRLEKRSVELGEYDENMLEYQIKSGLTKEDAITFPEEGLEEGMTTVISEDGSMGQSNPQSDGAGAEDMMMEEGTGTEEMMVQEGTGTEEMMTEEGAGTEDTMVEESTGAEGTEADGEMETSEGAETGSEVAAP